MPRVKIQKIKVHPPETDTLTTPTHPLHNHRPVIIMLVGFLVMLGIMTMVMANNQARVAVVRQFAPETITTDTTNWPDYTDATSGLSFKYPSDWNIQTMESGLDKAIVLSAKKDTHIKISIYISKSGYLGFDGLPEVAATLNGLPATAVTSALLGLEKNGSYYTFDAGLTAASIQTFNTLLSTVHFN